MSPVKEANFFISLNESLTLSIKVYSKVSLPPVILGYVLTKR